MAANNNNEVVMQIPDVVKYMPPKPYMQARHEKVQDYVRRVSRDAVGIRKREIMNDNITTGDNPPRYDNGFLGTIDTAYNQHHDLVLRPDDIWLAVLNQVIALVSKNSEAFRATFVTHEGKENVRVTVESVNDVDEFVSKVTSTVNDMLSTDDMKQWAVPDFSTTTDSDKMVFGIAMLSTLKEYFALEMHNLCRAPSIRILGTVEDWKDLRGRIERLTDYISDEVVNDIRYNEKWRLCPVDFPSKWKAMLLDIVDNFIQCYEGDPNYDFFGKIYHYEKNNGSGIPGYITGWLSVFSLINQNGVVGYYTEVNGCAIDYPAITKSGINSGCFSVPVKVIDAQMGEEYKTTLLAGHMFTRCVDETTIAPSLNWMQVRHE